MGLQAKNIRSRALFFVRNVVAAFEDGKLKENLHGNQVSALNAANKYVRAINAKRRKRAKAKTERTSIDVRAKPIPSIRENPWAILNPTLLDNLVREEPDIAPSHPYRAVPAALAQSVIQQVCADMQGFHRAMKEYRKNPSRFTGKPAMPDYHGENAVSSFEIPISRTTGKNLPPIAKKEVACDVACREYLSEEQKALWDNYALGEEIQKTVSFLPPTARPKSFRVTFNKGRPNFGVVFDIDIELPEDSIMVRVLGAAAKKAGTRHTKFGTEVQKKPTEEAVLSALRSIDKTDKIAGLDFGVTNLLALVFGNGGEGTILSSSRIARKLGHKRSRIDKWKSENMPARLKELQTKRDTETLSRAEFGEMKRLTREFYSHPEYVKQTASLSRWSDDAFKKVAAGVVRQLKKNGVEALVVGLNKGWKRGSEMGSRLNQAFHGLAHSRILGMLRSAGERNGILVVSTEESYTSKVSFCNGTKLKTFGEGSAKTEETGRTKLPRSGNRKKEDGGQRGSKDRHAYRNEGDREGKPSNWRRVVHADINGAFNILRKVFGWFAFDETLTLDYTLHWLSPKLGLAPMTFLRGGN